MKNQLLQFCTAAILILSVVSCTRDNAPTPPVNTSALTFTKISSFTNGTGEEGFAEISAFDPLTAQLFIVNPAQAEISVWDLSNSKIPIQNTGISVSGIPNSVAVHEGKVAVALENTTSKQANGTIALYDATSKILENTYPAGALPDMVAFSPDGNYIITANEGEPNDEYTNDPEGSITIVDRKTKQAVTIGFTAFNGQTIGNDFRIFGKGASVAQDIEPEYVAVSKDSKTAYVTLQENNGIAVVDLQAKTVTSIIGLGVKDHSLVGNQLDASNKDDRAGNFKNWPVFGLYQPDAIEAVEIKGSPYLVTANEGDARDYDGFSEEVRIKDLVLDPDVFPDAATLQLDENLGRLKTTTANGDIDNDGDVDQLYAYGARSFTIWNTSGSVIYDSGDFLGKKTFELRSDLFNNNDSRSDDKGAEPESVITLKIGDKTLLFIGLERTGGVFVFDMTDPFSPTFLQWLVETSDIGPEGLTVVPAIKSPTEHDLLIVTNEVSSTVTVYEIK